MTTSVPFYPRGKTAKKPVYRALGIKPKGRRKIPGFRLFGTKGESTKNLEEAALGPLAECEEGKIFIPDDLPGIEKAIWMTFLEAG